MLTTVAHLSLSSVEVRTTTDVVPTFLRPAPLSSCCHDSFAARTGVAPSIPQVSLTLITFAKTFMSESHAIFTSHADEKSADKPRTLDDFSLRCSRHTDDDDDLCLSASLGSV